MRITVLGAGAWGTAVSIHAALKHDVMLWARDADAVSRMRAERSNPRYLPNRTFPAKLTVTADFSEAIQYASGENDLLVLAVPLAALRETVERLAEHSPRHIIWLCKGLEAQSGLLPHQIVNPILKPLNAKTGVLSGPSFAKEVAAGLPVALTIGATDHLLREVVKKAFHHHAMRIYGAEDVIGIEVGGAIKNVLAVAAGACDGLHLGLNARAALLTRGLAEMSRLAVALGGKAETVMGLTGVGDLLLTATGDLSRNRQVGLALAAGQDLPEILQQLGHVAEGVRCARAVRDQAHQHHIEMPIVEAVCAVLFEGMPVAQAVTALLQRDPRDEHLS